MKIPDASDSISHRRQAESGPPGHPPGHAFWAAYPCRGRLPGGLRILKVSPGHFQRSRSEEVGFSPR